MNRFTSQQIAFVDKSSERRGKFGCLFVAESCGRSHFGFGVESRRSSNHERNQGARINATVAPLTGNFRNPAPIGWARTFSRLSAGHPSGHLPTKGSAYTNADAMTYDRYRTPLGNVEQASGLCLHRRLL
jgi:hypothetical protein